TMFLNPSSGGNDGLVAAAAEAGLEVVSLRRELDVPAMVRDGMRDGKRLFVAAGGDGTVNCVIQALVSSEAVLGVIPLGTFNHFARDVGVPLTWREALDVALNGTTRQVDAARAHDRFFLNHLSLGLSPASP